MRNGRNVADAFSQAEKCTHNYASRHKKSFGAMHERTAKSFRIGIRSIGKKEGPTNCLKFKFEFHAWSFTQIDSFYIGSVSFFTINPLTLFTQKKMFIAVTMLLRTSFMTSCHKFVSALTLNGK